jgi:hypothetical protein
VQLFPVDQGDVGNASNVQNGNRPRDPSRMDQSLVVGRR